MNKVIKLSINDIENIIKKTLRESDGFDDFDTQIQPEELPGADDYEKEEEMKREIIVGKGEDGRIYVGDVKTGKILGVK